MLRLTHKIDFCPAGEVPGKLGIQEDQLLIPDARTFDGEESARAFCEAAAFSGQHQLVGLVALEPKVSATATKAIEKLRGSAVELAERIKTLAMPDPVTGEDAWLGVMKQEILLRNQQVKSKNKSCPVCGAVIPVAYLKTFECPVCHSEDFLTTTGDQDKIRSREERLGNARKELAGNAAKLAEAERTALLDSVEFKKVWLVYAEVAECCGCAGPAVAVDEDVAEEYSLL